MIGVTLPCRTNNSRIKLTQLLQYGSLCGKWIQSIDHTYAKTMDKTFGQLIRQLRNKAGKSRYQLWKFSGIDQSYIAKLENGEKDCPSRSTVILLGMGLLRNCDQLELSDIEELLLAADFAPLRKRDFSREAKIRPENKQLKD